MSRHLSDDQVIDIVDGVGGTDAERHVAVCVECRELVAISREGWALAREAEMPEPSPLYWEAFRQQVGRRIDGESRQVRQWRFGAGLVAAAALLAVVALRIEIAPTAGGGESLPAWSALPPEDEDEALPVLSAVATNLDWSCSGADCLVELSEDESRRLAEGLQQAMAVL